MMKLNMSQRQKRRQGGFTLTEIMVAVFIIGLLSTVVVLSVPGLFNQGRMTKVTADLSNFRNALYLYQGAMRSYPSEQQGLDALVEKPEGAGDSLLYPKGGFITKKPTDPWGREYVYKVPGSDGKPFDIYTLGADGQQGGEDENADISVWDIG